MGGLEGGWETTSRVWRGRHGRQEAGGSQGGKDFKKRGVISVIYPPITEDKARQVVHGFGIEEVTG